MMLPLLITTTNEKQPDCAVVWDLLGGCPIATLSGEQAHAYSLMPFVDGVVCTSARKPFIQYWNFQSPNFISRRILTKGVATALQLTSDGEFVFIAISRDVYVYQTSSGCLVAVLQGSHSTTIGNMKLISHDGATPFLLITADSSGFIACWSLTGLFDNNNSLTASRPETNKTSDSGATLGSDVKHSPLWYTVHASHGLPTFVNASNMLVVAGTEGIKLFDLLDGTVLGTGLTELAGGLHSICVTPFPDKRIFCGGVDGMLYSLYIGKNNKSVDYDRDVRRCFVNTKSSTPLQKTITHLAFSDAYPTVLVVGSRGGLIEVLRLDSILSTLQQFSILNPTSDSTSTYHLTGCCLVLRPNWLSHPGSGDRTLEHANSTEDEDSSSTRFTCPVESFKRHFGWQLDDRVRAHLPGFHDQFMLSGGDANAIFLDDFCTVRATAEPELSIPPEQDLASEVERLTAANRELLRKLVDYELRS